MVPLRHSRAPVIRALGPALIAASCVLWSACPSDRTSKLDAAIDVTPATIEFPRTTPGARVRSMVTLTNRGRATTAVKLTPRAPFSIEGDTFDLASGESRAIELHFLPETTGGFTEPLEITAELITVTATLVGHAIGPLDCAQKNPCATASFDAITASCITSPITDGIACTTSCVTHGMCTAGECVGQSLSCDDGDPCTVDACGDSGCVYPPVECEQPSNPCRVSRCDPLLGCVTEDAEDGTACGRVSCDAARVCIGGSCTSRALANPADCGGYLRCGEFHCAATAVAVHQDHACALSEAGNVRCWGDNSHGQLGRVTLSLQHQPPGPVEGLAPEEVKSLVPGYGAQFSCVQTHQGALKCWGRGVSANGVSSSNPDRHVPTELKFVPADYLGVTLGPDVLCFTRPSGDLRCEGSVWDPSVRNLTPFVGPLQYGVWNFYGLNAQGELFGFGWYQPTPGNAATTLGTKVTGFNAPVERFAVNDDLACAATASEVRCSGSSDGHRSLGPSFFDSVPVPGIAMPIRDLALTGHMGAIVDAHGEVILFDTYVRSYETSPGIFDPLPEVPKLTGVSGGEFTICGLDVRGRVLCNQSHDLMTPLDDR